jgi:hypothetical protein
MKIVWIMNYTNDLYYVYRRVLRIGGVVYIDKYKIRFMHRVHVYTYDAASPCRMALEESGGRHDEDES